MLKKQYCGDHLEYIPGDDASSLPETGCDCLYSRTKELQWSNPDKYDNVVVMMGGLHMLFNFMKAIGQHMKNAGLDDVWVESGAFAQNSASAMIEGKAYIRTVRGHVIALCWIK